jgi:hypothetical protein
MTTAGLVHVRIHILADIIEGQIFAKPKETTQQSTNRYQ